MILKDYKQLYEECKILRQDGCSMSEIAIKLGVSKSTVSRWLNEKSKPITITKTYSKETLIGYLKQSTTKLQLLDKLGLQSGGSHYSKLYKLYANIGIDIDDYFRKNNDDIIPNEEIFIRNSPWSSSSRSTKIKNRVLKHDLLPYVCQSCGNEGVWNGRELTLQLHHINGINNDNRLENLEFLCPNCHTQTDNYAGKNK